MNYYGFYRSKMRIARSRNIPPVPTTLGELSETLAEYQPMREYFRGCAIGEDNSMGLIFIHPGMIKPLERCTQLYCDGTFKVNF